MEGSPILLPLEMLSLVEYRTPAEWEEINQHLAGKIGRDPAAVVASFLCTPLTILYEKNVPHCSLM